MSDGKIIIKRQKTERYIGLTEAAKKLGVSRIHLTRCLHGERDLAREKLRRIRIVDVEVEDSHA